MDVPSWHPANQDSDAARRLLMAPATSTPRTEFKVMVGSSGDTTTEAGRQLMSDLTGSADAPVPYEGRGFFDTSDRLYLLEQKKIQEAQKNKRKAEEDAQLQSFRSTALKLQSQKPSVLVPEVVASSPVQAKDAAKSIPTAKKKALPTIVTIKPKKRGAPASTESDKKKLQPVKKKQVKTPTGTEAAATSSSGVKETAEPDEPPTAAKLAAKPAAGALLLGYSSSSDSDA